jgi:hypothetical protein
LVVVTIVPEGGSPLGEVLEVGLVDLFEEGVLGGEAGVDGGSFGSEEGRGAEAGRQKQGQDVGPHRRRVDHRRAV